MSAVPPAVPAELAPAERHRLAELEAVVERGMQTFVEVGSALAEIRDRRLYRESHETFEAYCRARWGWSRRHANRTIEAAAVAEALGPMGPTNERQARELAPVLRDEGDQAVVDLVRELQAEYGEGKVTARVIREAVTRRLERGLREQRLAEERERLRELGADLGPADGRWELFHADLRDLDLPSDSIDVAICDPPYPPEFLPLYGALAELAARVLKPGGSVLAMAGPAHMYAAHALMAEHLRYHWTVSYVMSPPGAQFFVKGVTVGWKPVLWFTKGVRQSGSLTYDTVTSPAPEKQLHPWQQSTGGMLALVERFSRPGDVVLDPFVGAGTTAVAALQLGRRFVDCDVDEHAVAVTRARLIELEREAA